MIEDQVDINTHESYVSLETAKMLKEAGFIWPCRARYIHHKEAKCFNDVTHWTPIQTFNK